MSWCQYLAIVTWHSPETLSTAKNYSVRVTSQFPLGAMMMTMSVQWGPPLRMNSRSAVCKLWPDSWDKDATSTGPHCTHSVSDQRMRRPRSCQCRRCQISVTPRTILRQSRERSELQINPHSEAARFCSVAHSNYLRASSKVHVLCDV